MRCCLLLVCLLVRCFPVTGPSLMRLLVRLSLVCCWSVTGLLLVCHWSVTGLLLVCSGHGRWSGSLIVHPSCIPRASLVHRSCVARASLVCLFLFLLVCCSSVVGHGRCSACCSPVAPPACLSVGPSLSCHSSVCWPVAARPSLMYRWSVCLSITGCRCPVPVQGHRSIAHPSARASARASFIHRSSICSSVCSCIAHPSLIHLLVRLFESGLLVAGPSLLSLTSLSRVSDGSVCSFVVGLSPRPAARVVVAAPWLVCHSSFTDPSLVMAARASARSSRVALPVALPVAFLSAVLSPVCLLGSWSLACSSVGGLLFVRHWPWSSICYSCTACLSPRLSCRSFACCSAIGPPLLCLLVCLLVRRWSVCWCVAGLSVGASLVHLLVHHWSICSCITGPSVRASLVYLLLCRWSVCSFVARPYVRVMSLVRLIIRLVVHRSSPIPLRWSAGPSARVMVGVSSLVHLLVSHWLVHLLVSHWLVYWSRGHGSYRWSVCSLVTRPSVRVMSLVRLLESWSLVRLIGSWPLACSSVAGLLFVRRWPWSSICHWYIARASARLVVGVSLVCC